MTASDKHILLLAGTFEARRLASEILQRFPSFRLTPSFAGVVKELPDLGCPIRVGGFGGSEGLEDFCREEAVSLIIDATHPFAVQMSDNAAQAASILDLRLLRLERPAWQPGPDDNWQRVPSMNEAVLALPQDARAFLTVGRKEIGKFLQRTDIFALVRMIEPPEQYLPEHWKLILQRPAQSTAEEADLLNQHGITHVVAKNGGGERSYAKITAARELGLTVVMIDRPFPPSLGKPVAGIEEAMQELNEILGG